jgi:hypothetical protein
MDFIEQMAASGAVVAALTTFLWWLRHKGLASLLQGRRTSDRRLERLEYLSLGPQHALHLVRLGETTLLLASFPAGCTLVQAVPRQQLEVRQ